MITIAHEYMCFRETIKKFTLYTPGLKYLLSWKRNFDILITGYVRLYFVSSTNSMVNILLDIIKLFYNIDVNDLGRVYIACHMFDPNTYKKYSKNEMEMVLYHANYGSKKVFRPLRFRVQW